MNYPLSRTYRNSKKNIVFANYSENEYSNKVLLQFIFRIILLLKRNINYIVILV